MAIMQRTVLVVDDDPHIRDLLTFALRKAGLATREAADGEAALADLDAFPSDLVVLDINMPRMDGIEVCRRIRAKGDLPVLFLSSRDDEFDRVLGIELGADDYVTKPFSPREVVARVRAVLRRAAAPEDDRQVLARGPMEIDLPRMKVTIDGRPIDLTATEFQLLTTMARRPGQVFTRGQLLDAARGDAFAGYERAIDAHIKNIRRKLEPDSAKPIYIQTVYGVGYRFAEE